MCLLNTNDAMFWWIVLYSFIGILIALCIQDEGGDKKIPLAVLTALIWPIVLAAATWTLVKKSKGL